MTLVTASSPPNTVVQVQPGLAVEALYLVVPGTGATLVTGQGHQSNVVMSVQPGMYVRTACQVSPAGVIVNGG
jgi:hypothetical protein